MDCGAMVGLLHPSTRDLGFDPWVWRKSPPNGTCSAWSRFSRAPMQARGGKPILWRKSGLVTLHQDGLSVKGKKNQSLEVQVVKKALKRCSLKYFRLGFTLSSFKVNVRYNTNQQKNP
ncbi:hypothetical protein H5410_024009 [Solanum commersonii]|uniref:Uncharacterized protein n=1 Tax=Solanum commersonii TaxID=4109 RepID=A0A9J5ZKS9_SOLCO|nr:hypothetical protein H5410_024009 [Solanum commersonii]